MAKDAHDREDLLRDATAFTKRIELRVRGSADNVFCGVRANGALSLFWGQATVAQFNVNDELRRAFWLGRMVATYHRKLHWLQSPEGTGRVRLQRVEFTEAETGEFLKAVTGLLKSLRESLTSKDFDVVGEFPVAGNIAQELHSWLERNQELRFALHPGVGKK